PGPVLIHLPPHSISSTSPPTSTSTHPGSLLFHPNLHPKLLSFLIISVHFSNLNESLQILPFTLLIPLVVVALSLSAVWPGATVGTQAALKGGVSLGPRAHPSTSPP